MIEVSEHKSDPCSWKCPLPEPKPQNEIISEWGGSASEPFVSICCITFNHEKYIENALKSFLLQKTDFPFEILVHDDASSDSTPAIIEDYQKRYPKIIKPVYQIENQYSKGVKINPTYNFPRAKGKFIAMCEGDDYWISEDKLQRQYEISVKTGCAVVFHSAVEVSLPEGSFRGICKQREGDGFISLFSTVKGRGGFMPTASLFFPTKFVEDIRNLLSEHLPLGDFFLQVMLGFKGKIFYIDREMCVYRRNSPGSWTSEQKRADAQKKYAYDMMKSIEYLYDFLGFEYRRYYLALPYFFYARKYYSTDNSVVSLMSKMLITMPIRKFSLAFHLLYLSQFVRLPASTIVEKFGKWKNTK